LSILISAGALIIEFVSVRVALVIEFSSLRTALIIALATTFFEHFLV